MFTLLFFDDWYLSARTNFARHVGQPKLVPEGMFEDPYADVSWGYPTVFQDPSTGRWRCLYQGEPTSLQHLPLLLESDDGVHWEIPDLSAEVYLEARICPHQLFGREQFHEWSPVFVDARAYGTDHWLKGLVVAPSGGIGPTARLVTSRDAVHWQPQEGIRWHPYVGDPIATTFWNPYRESYVITARPTSNDRRVAVLETRDWEHFSAPELAIQADALDTPCAETYGMPVFQYEHMFIGLLWIYHTSPIVDADHKYLTGKIDCYLSYSYNGWHFQRTVREPLLANSSPGEHGAGCIYVSSLVQTPEVIRLYSSSSKSEHAVAHGGKEAHQSALLLHELRPDGFVYLQPEGGRGELLTRLLLWEGGELQVNLSAPYGVARIQVTESDGSPIEGYQFDDCIPFTGDTLAWKPAWSNGRTLDALKNRIVRIGVQLMNGRLYALRGEFEVKMLTESWQFKQQGINTPRRIGF